VKLLMALGAWGGYAFVEEAALLSVLLGGVMAAAALVARGRMRDFLRRARATVSSAVASVFVRGLEPVPFRADPSSKLPFGIPIAVAAVWTAATHPLVAAGGFRAWP
jgi:Flp pilus assembly protein protease CpaA